MVVDVHTESPQSASASQEFLNGRLKVSLLASGRIP